MPEDIAVAGIIDTNECRLAAAARIFFQKSTVNSFGDQTVTDLLSKEVIADGADQRDGDAETRQRDQCRCHRSPALQQQRGQFGLLVKFGITAGLSKDVERTLTQANHIKLILNAHGIP